MESDDMIFESVKSAAEYFKVSRRTLHTWINKGKLKVEYL
jgi:excisionase family DNA binding protein